MLPPLHVPRRPAARPRSRLIACAAAAIFLAGCGTSDLSSKADVTSGVAECLPPGTPSPAATVRAMWFPDAQGVASTEDSPARASGVLVLAGDTLWFMAWNAPEHHYDMLHDIAFLRAQRVAVDTLGTATVLVIQSSNDTYDAFELLKGGSLTSDGDAARALYARIQALRAGNPQKDS
ncbi:MAG TPA: hypothetical protein VGG37_08145 [Opitutaceae bacterium]|jgi:hypothetical protein